MREAGSWLKIMLWGIVIALVLMALWPHPAGAHDQEAQTEWYDEWEERAILGITPELLAELLEFTERHKPPAYTGGVTDAPDPTGGAWTGMGSNVEQWRGLVASYGGWNVNIMMCLMSKESGGNPNAVNAHSGAAGLFQVMPFWWDHYGGDRFDPATNIRVAHAIWQQQGYAAWSPYNRGSCR